MNNKTLPTYSLPEHPLHLLSIGISATLCSDEALAQACDRKFDSANHLHETSLSLRTRACRSLTSSIEGITGAKSLRKKGKPDNILYLDRTENHLECKFQLKKLNRSDIGQCDYVHDDTSFLRALRSQDIGARDAFCDLKIPLTSKHGDDADWTLASLWLADIAGLRDSDDRTGMNIYSPRDLNAYLNKKWLLHMWSTGEYVCRLSEIDAVNLVMENPDRFTYMTKKNSKSLAVYIRVNGCSDNKPVFTYRVYRFGLYTQNSMTGRHKLNYRAFKRSAI